MKPSAQRRGSAHARRNRTALQLEKLEDRLMLSNGGFELIPNLAITTDPGVQQMPSIAVDPLDSDHLVVSYMDYSLVATGYAGIGVSVSQDGGQTWQATSIDVPDPFEQGAANPITRFDDQGNVYVSFMAATFLDGDAHLTNGDFWDPELGVSPRGFGTRANNGVFVARSEDGLTWGEPVAVVSSLYDGIDDVPFDIIPDLAIDTFSELPDGQPDPMYVTWTRLYPPGQFPGEAGSTGGGEIMIAVSRDGGQSWETQLRDGRTVIVLPGNFGTGPPPGLTIPDQSHLAIGSEGEVHVSMHYGGNFTVQVSTDGGASFAGPDDEFGQYTPFGPAFDTSISADGLANNQFRTHAVRAIGADPTRPGHVYVADAIRIMGPRGDQIDGADAFFARSSDHGETWDTAFMVGASPPDFVELPAGSRVPLNDENSARSATGAATDVVAGQALPRLTVDANGNIGVIWYDTRGDPADHLLDVFGTFSTDGGLTFSPNFRITDVSVDADLGVFTNAVGGQEYYLGDFIGLAMADGMAYATWTDTRHDNQDIFFARFAIDPAPTPPNDRFELNDTPETATELGPVVRRLLPRLAAAPGDQDWFLLEASATGELTVSAEREGPALSPADGMQLQLWDQTATTLLTTGEDLLDENGKVIGRGLRHPGQAGASYLVRIVGPDASPSAQAVGYSLWSQSLTADLGVRVYASVNGTVGTGSVLYLLTPAAAGSIDVRLTEGANVQGDLSFRILDPDTLEMLASGQGSGAIEEASLPVRQGQSVLVSVSGEDGSTGDFALELTNLDQSATPQNVTLFFQGGAGPSELALGDLNLDGNPDLVVSNALSNTISVLLGNGDGMFQAPRQFALGAFATPNLVLQGLPNYGRDVAVADIDGDAIPDVIVTNYDSSDVSVLLGRGDGTFQPQRRFDATRTPFALDVGYLDQDDVLDLIVVDSHAGPSTAAVLLGRGDGTFEPQRTFPAPIGDGFPTSAVRIADLDDDGRNDLAFSGRGEPFLGILLGDGDGTFRPGGSFRGGRPGPGLAVADLDGDGDLDVVAADFLGNHTVSLFLANGDGTFQEVPPFFAGQHPVDVAVVDYGSQIELSDGSTSLGPPDGNLDLVITNSGVPTVGVAVGSPEVVVLPGIVGDDGEFVTFGRPQRLVRAKAPTDLEVGDVNGDGVPDLVVVDLDGILVIFGEPPLIVPNDTPQTARDLGTVVHIVDQTQTIVPGRQDAYYTLTVPGEALAGAGDEVIDFSGFFEAEEGAGLQMDVYDSGGTLLASGERFRIAAPQGEELLLHVHGEAGAFTPVIDVLPQIVSVESQAFLPGAGVQPGGATTSLVVAFQGDRLDPVGAEDPGNWTVTWLGPDGAIGGGDDVVIPVGGAGIGQSIVYNPGANIEPTSGLTYPTSVRQTVNLIFADPLPAGSYMIEASAGVQAAPFNEGELALLTDAGGYTGHPVVTVVGIVIDEGGEATVTDLVFDSGALGDFSVFETGTPFLTQLHDDLSALLDSLLTELGDDVTITEELLAQVLARLEPALGPADQRSTPILMIVLDPVNIDLVDRANRRTIYALGSGAVENSIPDTHVAVASNIETVTVAGAGGEYLLNIAQVPQTARGFAVAFDAFGTRAVSITEEMRSGVKEFSFWVGEPESVPESVVLHQQNRTGGTWQQEGLLFADREAREGDGGTPAALRPSSSTEGSQGAERERGGETASPGDDNGPFESPYWGRGGQGSRAKLDLDGDGKTDVVVADALSNTIRVHSGKVDGTFEAPRQFTFGELRPPNSDSETWPPFRPQVSIADFNGDGDADVVVADAFSNTISMLLGNGDGTFEAPRQFTFGEPRDPNPDSEIRPQFGRDVRIADVNRDRLPDIVVTDYDSSDVWVLLGSGDGTFEPPPQFDATPEPPSAEDASEGAPADAAPADEEAVLATKEELAAEMTETDQAADQPARAPAGSVGNGGDRVSSDGQGIAAGSGVLSHARRPLSGLSVPIALGLLEFSSRRRRWVGDGRARTLAAPAKPQPLDRRCI